MTHQTTGIDNMDHNTSDSRLSAHHIVPYSVQEQCDLLITTHYGKRDLVLACTAGDVKVRQEVAAWAQHRVRMTMGVSLCTGSPATQIDLSMMGVTGLITVASCSESSLVSVECADLIEQLVFHAGSAGTVIFCGVDEALSQATGQACHHHTSRHHEIPHLLQRFAHRYPLVITEVRDGTLALDPALENLRLQVETLVAPERSQRLSTQAVYEELMNTLGVRA